MTTVQYQSILDDLKLEPYYFTWKIAIKTNNALDTFIEEYIERDLYVDEDYEKVLALMENQDLTWDVADNAIDDHEWEVLTDCQADAMTTSRANGFLDDIILPEVPDHLHKYFDSTTWVADYVEGGRGNAIASYDSEELEETINETTYYLYKC